MTEQDQSAFILHSNWPVETKRGNIEYCRICTSISAFESVRYLCVIIFQIAMLQAIHLIFHSAYMIAIISLNILPMYKDHRKYAIQIIYRRYNTIFLFFSPLPYRFCVEFNITSIDWVRFTVCVYTTNFPTTLDGMWPIEIHSNQKWLLIYLFDGCGNHKN